MLAQAPKAIPWLEKLPEVNEADYMLGYAYLQNAQPDRSEAAFARLFRLKPDTAAAHATAAQMMLKKEFQDQASAEAAQALSLDPNVPRAHFLLGEIAISHGDLDGAIGHLKKEIGLDPGYAMAWYRLGDAYARGENWDLAVPDLQRAIWLNPDFSGPFILLGKCYFKQRNFSNAEGILRGALALDPRNREATYLLGQTLLASGRAAEGKALLEEIKVPPQLAAAKDPRHCSPLSPLAATDSRNPPPRPLSRSVGFQNRKSVKNPAHLCPKSSQKRLPCHLFVVALKVLP